MQPSNVPAKGYCSGPPTDPKWMCGANTRHGPCKRWKLKGAERCQFHGGRQQQQARGGNFKRQNSGLYAMPRFYTKFLTKSLSDALEESTGVAPSEQLQLYEELALVRIAAGDAVKTWAVATQALEECTDAKKKPVLENLRDMAACIMRDHLREVVSICESAARIESNAKDKVSIHQLHYFVNQIVRCAYHAFEDNIENAQVFEEYVRKTIHLPSPGNEGTSLTPDMDVQAMDDSIPAS